MPFTMEHNSVRFARLLARSDTPPGRKQPGMQVPSGMPNAAHNCLKNLVNCVGLPGTTSSPGEAGPKVGLDGAPRRADPGL